MLFLLLDKWVLVNLENRNLHIVIKLADTLEDVNVALDFDQSQVLEAEQE